LEAQTPRGKIAIQVVRQLAQDDPDENVKKKALAALDKMEKAAGVIR
jgi:hypothetical protein